MSSLITLDLIKNDLNSISFDWNSKFSYSKHKSRLVCDKMFTLAISPLKGWHLTDRSCTMAPSKAMEQLRITRKSCVDVIGELRILFINSRIQSFSSFKFSNAQISFVKIRRCFVYSWIISAKNERNDLQALFIFLTFNATIFSFLIRLLLSSRNILDACSLYVNWSQSMKMGTKTISHE